MAKLERYAALANLAFALFEHILPHRQHYAERPDGIEVADKDDGVGVVAVRDGGQFIDDMYGVFSIMGFVRASEARRASAGSQCPLAEGVLRSTSVCAARA